jgi:S-adenosylmethionine synthetase
VAAETLTTTNKVIVAGETRGTDRITPAMIQDVAREAIKDIGYEQDGFHWKTADIDVLLHDQSIDIAQGVDQGDGLHKEEGAGDQGIMFGYASSDTKALMPAPVYYSHKILERLAKARKQEGVSTLGPDSKSQVTIAYENGKPVRAEAIVVSTQHLDPNLNSKDIADIVKPYVFEVMPEGWITDETIWHINPTGKFVIGGPDGDTGLTGRKIIVDTYGGMAPHGGGAFSGKDPTKVDRSAAYATRYLAKNIVAAGLAPWVEIQISYAIGVASPTSIYVNVDDTNAVSGAQIEDVIRKVMDLTPRGIRSHLNLNQPIYARTAAYGHFGRTPDTDGGFSWEKTDLVDAIKAAL